ncbi:MAG: co-chaperone GroES [Planctomycetes bacterium]|nr:co-chaperone GroES [Planctomycetota bacterium]
MKRLVPLGDKVVVKPLEAEEKTAGGIVLPDAAREKPRQGRVLSVGDGRLMPDGTRAKHEVREGDRVIYSQYSGSEVKVGEDEFLIMGEDDILAVVG